MTPGDTFHLWTVIVPAPNKALGRALVRCVCGTEREVLAYTILGKAPKSKSCGCGGRSLRKSLAVIHRHMVARCSNPKERSYPSHGGRGIECRFSTVADLEAALPPRPSPAHSVDRIDVNGHYEVGNVRWATAVEQAANRRGRPASLLTFGPVTDTLNGWALRLGIPPTTIYALIARRSLSPREALTHYIKTRPSASLEFFLLTTVP